MTSPPRTNCIIGDDHELLRRGIAALLAPERGFAVVGEAATTAETLSLVERRRPDVLIVEARSAQLDGVEVCRQVAARVPGTAVVLYSAHRDLDLLEEGLAAGAAAIDVKTGPPEDLIRALHSVAAGRTFVDAELAAGLLGRRREREKAVVSRREREVLQLLAEGRTTDAVGRDLFLSPTTVRSYAESAIRKLGAENRLHAVAKAMRLAIIE